MKKERNYTIEFFRFMLAVNFVLFHALMIFPIGFLKGFPLYVNGFDVIIPFMAFSGFFLMQGYKKLQAKGLTEGIPPSCQAGDYLKARLVSLLPVFFLAQFLGFLANRLWQGTPLKDWPVYFLNAIGEFAGLQITGFGLGNASVGPWGVDSTGINLLLNTPLWFISGIFVLGYFIYYLIARNEKHFIGFIAPLAIILFYASEYMSGESVPLWTKILSLGSFNIADGFLNMFCGMSIGVLLWVACDKLKEKKWSPWMIAVMTIFQIILMAVVMIKSWVSMASPFAKWFNIGWGATYLLTVFFCFFILLNVDKCTRFPLFSSRIWALPGRLAFYIYMLHFPIIILCGMALGFKGVVLGPENAPVLVPKIILNFVIALIISILAAIVVMLVDTKLIRPWLAGSPWFSKEPEEAGVEIKADKE